MKIAFAISCNDLYSTMAWVLLKSIRVNDKDFNYDFYIICNEGLSQENRDRLSNIYPVKFKEYDNGIYKKYDKQNLKYRSIEMFTLYEYDKVIQLGADALCLHPVKDIVNTNCNIGMPREKLRNNMFSSGIMIIGKKYLNAETYLGLLKSNYSNIKMFGNDMKMYNCYFKNDITEINYKFNVMNSETDYIKTKDIVFLHYCHKPQATRGRVYQWIYDLWDGYLHMEVAPWSNPQLITT